MPFFTGTNTIRVLCLKEWLDMAVGQDAQWGVELPMIQRGFVWKPRQIIDLWDSLLAGMPIGALMVSEHCGPSVRLTGSDTDITPGNTPAQHLNLVDGQQRTLAMCMGWTAFVPDQRNHRLWVDLADTPPPGHLVRLRVTMINQPFGYRRDDPNSKLTLENRRRAREAFVKGISPDELLAQAVPHPAGARCSAPMDMGKLIKQWRHLNGDATKWQDWVREELRHTPSIALDDEKPVLKPHWDSFTEEQKQQTQTRLDALTKGLQKLFATQIPLVRIDPALFEPDNEEGAEPPLARLFQRIGSNATPLSNDDYIYSVLKHQMPEIHEAVQTLHARPGIASLLTATDLVMTALRLAAVNWHDGKGNPVPDNASLDKEQFHRLVMRPTGFANKEDQQAAATQRQSDMRALLQGEGKQSLAQLFAVVQDNLLYKDSKNDIGLPPLMLPYLGRPLVQVLLRLAHKGWLSQSANSERRAQMLRLVLWWQRWVTNSVWASHIAFDLISTSSDAKNFDLYIANAVVEADAGWAMHAPSAIAALGLDNSTRGENTPTIKDENRFATPEDDTARNRLVREFYRQWWHPWGYHHPMLLWLQRHYVQDLGEEAIAGAIDDTPYDFDHILPSAQWGADWRLVGKSGDIEEFRYVRNMLGNSIGNVRVWDASRNRSDGDASPRYKLQESILNDSAIDSSQLEGWQASSPDDESEKTAWSRRRALAFQRVVEQRSFALYRQLYEQAQFHVWESATSD